MLQPNDSESGFGSRPCFIGSFDQTGQLWLLACRWSIRSEVSGRGFIDQNDTLNTGDLVATIAVTRRFDLTDVQWAALEPLLPRGEKPGRPPKWSKRQLIDGIRWRVRVGSPWRDFRSVTGPGRRSTGCSAVGNARESGSASSPGCRPAPTPPV
ncbi:transposase [Micromonospora chersina]|uniref:transposase n=1 Tax=Micromonospora chersina TaxID=47854 RepID=UPI003CC6074F